MRLEQLLYFIEIAKWGSFSIAAENLNVTQPSISHAISSLERELGVRLFERSRSGTTLTKTGTALLKKAQSIMNMVNEIEDEAKAETDSFEGTLHIATVPSICNTFLTDVLSVFKKRHPFLRIELTEDGTNQIVQEVISNRADLGLVSHLPSDPIDDRLEFHSLLTGTYLLCVGKNSSVPLHNPMPAELILEQPLITFKNQYRQEEYLKKILKTEHLNTVFTLGYTEAAKKMIAQGVAIGFYPDFSIRNDTYVQSGDIIPLDVENNDLLLSFGWIRSRSQHFSLAARDFIRVLKEVVKDSD